MNTYELTVVLAGSMPDSKQKAVLEKIKKTVKDSEGLVEKADEWGKKAFSYKIRHEKEGYYYYFELSLPSDRVAGVNRVFENDDDILRQLLVVKSAKSMKSTKDTKSTTSKEKVQKDEANEEQKVEKPKKTIDPDLIGVDKKVKSRKIKKGKS